MLVFISDLHLVDGTTGNTINSDAFVEFADALQRLVTKQDVGIKEVKLVFLGDLFDLIRTTHWFDTTIRPWSGDQDTDDRGRTLKDWTSHIFREIQKNPENARGMSILRDFKDRLAKIIPVSFHYVIGNHDWLLNRYPDLRKEVGDFLNLDDPSAFLSTPFPEEVFLDGYRVFARHGDRFDWENYEGTRNAASLGDALVIELYNALPREAARRLQEQGISDTGLTNELFDIDNVRPIHEIPVWFDSICRKGANKEVTTIFRESWNDLVEKFFQIPFVSGHNAWGPDRFDLFKLIFRLGPGWTMEKALSIGESWSLDMYQKMARAEEALKTGTARFVVYGHTHRAETQPVGVVQTQAGEDSRFYFNSGTWRTILRRSTSETGENTYVGWQVMNATIFYLNDERKGRPFETWSGELALKLTHP